MSPSLSTTPVTTQPDFATKLTTIWQSPLTEDNRSPIRMSESVLSARTSTIATGSFLATESIMGTSRETMKVWYRLPEAHIQYGPTVDDNLIRQPVVAVHF